MPSHEFIIDNFEDGTSILTLPETYPDDVGEIVYEAQNPLGVATTVTHLLVETVEGNCLLTLFLLQKKFSNNEPVHFSSAAAGSPLFMCVYLFSPLVVYVFFSITTQLKTHKHIPNF